MRIVKKIRIVDKTFVLCSEIKKDRFISYNEKNYDFFISKEKENIIIKIIPKKFILNKNAKLCYKVKIEDEKKYNSAIGFNYSAIKKYIQDRDTIYEYTARHRGISNLYVIFYKKGNFIDIFLDDADKTICHPFDFVIKKKLYNDFLERNDGLIIHASAVVIDGKGIIFVGDSGYGKTTLAYIFKNNNHTVISDDMVALKSNGRCIKVYPLPWVQNSFYLKNTIAKLHYIFFPYFADSNKLREIDCATALKMMLRNIYIETEKPNDFLKIVDIINNINSCVRKANLYFTENDNVCLCIKRKLER